MHRLIPGLLVACLIALMGTELELHALEHLGASATAPSLSLPGPPRDSSRDT